MGKTLFGGILSVILVLSGLTAVAAETDAHWTFDSVAKTMTDGLWTFTNVTATATDLTVGSCDANGFPAEFSKLDLSKPVTNATGTSFTIKSLVYPLR